MYAFFFSTTTRKQKLNLRNLNAKNSILGNICSIRKFIQF